MPWTMAAFTVAALGMIGLPPTVGFVSKWYLGLGALLAGQAWVLAVLVASSLLNAAYFLPPIYSAWFGKPARDWPRDRAHGRAETRLGLLVPTLITAALVVALGVLAAAPFSPLRWVQFIAEQGFEQ
jgi:multicomponent Na+:H+ antiporter subunit D